MVPQTLEKSVLCARKIYVTFQKCWLLIVFSSLLLLLLFNPRTHTQTDTPIVVQGGGSSRMEPLPVVFDMLYYFEMILPLVESLWSSLQNEVYFIGGGAAGGLWRHQQW